MRLTKITCSIAALLMALFHSSEMKAQCSGGAGAGSIYPGVNFSFSQVFAGMYYNFNAAAGITYEFSFCAADGGNANFDSEITILDQNGLYAGGYNDNTCGNAAKVTWLCPASGTYRVLTTQANCLTSFMSTGSIAHRLIQPTNDDCSTAIAVPIPGVVIGNTQFAQPDNAPTCAVGNSASGGLWYTITGTGGVITASLCVGTNYDSRIRVFTGDCNNLQCVGGNDDACSVQSQVSFCSIAGRTYYILVHGWLTAAGSFRLALSSGQPTPVPVATASATTLCAGDTVTVSAVGSSSYSWTPANSVADPNAASTTIVPPAGNPVYIVAGLDNTTGCTQYDTLFLTVHALPNVQVTGDANLCTGDMTTLTVTGATNYLWNTGATTDIISELPVSNTTYIATGTDINGCSNSDTLQVLVHPLPTLSVTGDGDICVGDSTLLLATSNVSLLWSTGDTASSVYVQPNSNTTYSVTATDNNGCTFTTSFPIIVRPIPTIVTSGTGSYCENSPITINAASSAQNLVWLPGNYQTNSFTINADTNVTYIVYATDIYGCNNTDSVNINVLPLPQIQFGSFADTLCLNSAMITLVAQPAGGYWSGTGVNGVSFDPAVAGIGTHEIMYTYADNNGCANDDTTQIVVEVCAGIADISNTFDVSIYPNPNNGQFSITTSNVHNPMITIYNATGQVVFNTSEQAADGEQTISINTQLSQGLYLVEVISGNKRITKPVVIQ